MMILSKVRRFYWYVDFNMFPGLVECEIIKRTYIILKVLGTIHSLFSQIKIRCICCSSHQCLGCRYKSKRVHSTCDTRWWSLLPTCLCSPKVMKAFHSELPSLQMVRTTRASRKCAFVVIKHNAPWYMHHTKAYEWRKGLSCGRVQPGHDVHCLKCHH